MPTEVVILFLDLLPILYLSIFAHELGHALLAWAVGIPVTSFGAGTGRVLWVGQWRQVRIYFCANPHGGVTFLGMPPLFPSRRRRLPALAGGVLANLVLVLLSLGVGYFWPGAWPWWGPVAVINGLGLLNLVPLHTRLGSRPLVTDGGLILDVLRHGPGSRPTPHHLRAVRAWAPHWRAIGDRRALSLHLLVAAEYWLELGSKEQARFLLAEEALQGGVHTPFLDAYRDVLHSLLASAAGDSAAATRLLDDAQKRLQPLGDDCRFWIDQIRVGLLLSQGDTTTALVQLDALARHPLLKGRPFLQADLLYLRLRVLATANAVAEATACLADYENVTRRHPAATRDLHVYTAAARMFLRHGDRGRAAVAYEKAVDRVCSLYRELALPEDREAFEKHWTSLIREAEDCSLRGSEQPGGAVNLKAAVEEWWRRQEPLRRRRAQRWRRLGFGLTGVNLLGCHTAAVGVALVGRSVLHGWPDELLLAWMLSLFVLFFCSWVAAFLALFSWATARFWPEASASAGRVVLILAFFPWLATLLLTLGGVTLWLMDQAG